MRADRLLNIMLILQARGKTTSHNLAQELGVSRRTILRDIDSLSVAGVPVYAEGGHGGGFALDEAYRTTLTGLQADEIRTLFVTSNAQLLAEVGLGQASTTGLRKLLAGLPAAQQPSVAFIRQRLLIDPAWWWRDADLPSFWDQLQQAVYEDRCIRATYKTQAGKVTERTLEPFSLVAKSSIWYLVARRDGELRSYRVSRFTHLELLSEHFNRPADFDLPTYWQTQLQEFTDSISDYRFTLCIHPDRLNFVKWLAPGRCEVVGSPDSQGWFTARVRLDTLDLAKMLVFGLGSQAQVLDPPELLNAVINTAREFTTTNIGPITRTP
jgi:predicted DNA-binding transcriptional regulator YafY